MLGKRGAEEGAARVTKDTEKSSGSRFGAHASLYLVSNLLVRGLSILLTPLYTRVMSQEDFAIVSVANAVTTVLGIVLGLAIYSAVPRLYFDHAEGPARRRFLGTLTIFSLVFPLLLAAGLEVLGSAGLLDVFGTVRYAPHLRLVVWSAALGGIVNLPSTVYMTREEPRVVGALNLATALVQIGLTILMVAALRMGAVGVLGAGLASNAVMAVVSFLLLARLSDLVVVTKDLRAAIVYSVPIVPHLIANWALAVSDRLVLERYVPATEVSRYALAYLFATGIGVIGSAVTTPLNPVANRDLGDPETAKRIPPLGTYVLLVTVASALFTATCGRELVALFAPKAYAEAARFVPWVVFGSAIQGFYFVWSTGTWYSKRTALVPVVTLTSVIVNVGLNLVLVPRYGAIAAAITTAIGYAVSALLHGALAQRNHAIPWEYRRWGAMLVAALAAFFAVRNLDAGPALVAIPVKTLLSGLVFGGAFAVLGGVTAEERRRLAGLVARKRA